LTFWGISGKLNCLGIDKIQFLDALLMQAIAEIKKEKI